MKAFCLLSLALFFTAVLSGRYINIIYSKYIISALKYSVSRENDMNLNASNIFIYFLQMTMNLNALGARAKNA